MTRIFDPARREVTSAEDAWYATFGHVVSWYLEARGLRPELVRPVVHDTISGHFSSWCAPDAGQAKTACAALAMVRCQSRCERRAPIWVVCFSHPFADGNARAARLTLDYVLTSEGLALNSIEPVIVVSRAANDANGAWCLAYVIEQLLGSR